jgi:predicted esterase
MGGKSQALLLDFYEPVGDILEERPLIIMAHGGSFVGGDRTQTAEFCIDFASRGYTCANIEYRLLDMLVQDSFRLTEVVFMAINDMRAAVRYFREDASHSREFGISSDHIYAAGISAGAIMADHVGFLDSLDQVPEYIQIIMDKHGGFEGNSSENTQVSSQVHGVLNYSGALIRSHWIDSDDPPVYSAHDDLDPIVPCNYTTVGLLTFPAYLFGSCAMKTVADQMGVDNELYLVSNSTGHVSYLLDESTQKIVLDESAEFLSSIICNGTTHVTEKLSRDHSVFSVYPNPFTDILNIQSEATIQEVTVTSLTGQIFLQTGPSPGNSLELCNLPSGIYLVGIKTEDGSHVLKALKE